MSTEAVVGPQVMTPTERLLQDVLNQLGETLDEFKTMKSRMAIYEEELYAREGWVTDTEETDADPQTSFAAQANTLTDSVTQRMAQIRVSQQSANLYEQ